MLCLTAIAACVAVLLASGTAALPAVGAQGGANTQPGAPLVAAQVEAEAPKLPEVTTQAQGIHAAQAIVNTVRENPGEITLVATGPLTNVALAFRLDPEVPALLKKFIWMGGSTDHGNVTPSAEFNAFADPHAAHIVFHSGVKVHQFGLNVTLQVLVRGGRISRSEPCRSNCKR